MNKFLYGMFCDSATGEVSSSKVLNIVGFGTLTAVVLFQAVNNELVEWLIWAYIATFTPSRIMRNIIDLRWGKGNSPQTPPQKEDKE